MAIHTYPLPKFHFRVDWGSANIDFTEVTGLNVETDVILGLDRLRQQAERLGKELLNWMLFLCEPHGSDG